MWLLVWLTACGGGRPPAVTAAEAGPSAALSVDVPFAELSFPDSSRPLGRPAPQDVPITGDWVLVKADATRALYETALPVRPRALFYMSAPSGMELRGPDGARLSYGEGRKRGWKITSTRLTVALDPEAPPPGPGAYTLRYPLAAEREARLNYAEAGIEGPEAFVRTRVQSGAASYAGLLLPAPGVAAWDVLVPASAELHFRPGLVAPETLDGPPSDGAVFSVEIEADGLVRSAWSAPITGPSFEAVRVDLSDWAGQNVRLRFRTDPGATPTFDYAFWADPVLASRKADPKRVVLLFVDTMRRDHLGVYGYDRATSAPLDRWAADGAVVFEDARSVAPWTLPSARSVVTGRQPELYQVSETLQGRLREQGYATAMFAGNVYLSANFEMERGWGLHHVVNWPAAEDQVDLALDWLADQDGRDAMLLLHLMDPHLPYDEPAAYRFTFASASRPGKLSESFERGALMRANLRSPEERQWVVDRYDNNVAYAHDELGRVLRQLDEDDVVVYFADHGEELWDHGGFEHGHTLYDELLRVPLIVKAPGVAAGRVAEPASLLDVTPTVLDALGLPFEGLDGVSLLGAARGEPAAEAALAARPLAFGRPLYGDERWGVLDAGIKYTTTEGEEAAYDLAADPGERRSLVDRQGIEASTAYREAMGEALDREVGVGFRMVGGGRGAPQEDVIAELVVPGGVAAAWVGEDPTNKSSAAVQVDGERVIATWHAGYGGSREIYVIPALPLAEVTHRVALSVPAVDGPAGRVVIPAERSAVPDADRSPFGRVKLPNGRNVTLTWAIAPKPATEAAPIVGSDAELMEALRAMGYAVGEDEAPPKKE